MKEQIIDKMSSLVISAFGLVAALAWNDAIKGIFKQFEADGWVAKLVYASVVTVVAVIAALWIGYAAGKIKDLAGISEEEEAKK